MGSGATIDRHRPGRETTGTGDPEDVLGRIGLVGKGVLYSTIGLLAIQLAAGGGGDRAA